MAKLTLGAIKNQKKVLTETKDIIVTSGDGNEYEVKIKPYFTSTDITNILKESFVSIEKFKEFDLHLPEELYGLFVIYLAIKAKTDVETPNISKYKKEATYYDASLDHFIQMYDLDFITQISQEFLPDEIEKLTNAIKNYNQLIQNEEFMNDLSIGNNSDVEKIEVPKPKQIPEA